MLKIQSRKLRLISYIFVIVLLLFLLNGCTSNCDEKIRNSYKTTQQINTKIKSNDQWDYVLDVDFVDMCTDGYASKIRMEGQYLKEQAAEFKKYANAGQILDYEAYLRHFNKYDLIGDRLIELADRLSAENYEGALITLEMLKELI